MALKRKSTNKSPPIFSHEFVIQNHADIISCIAMIFVVGLMFQVTSHLASPFVALQHNISSIETEGTQDESRVIYYTYGIKDLCAIFFYFLICIVMHAVIQEYVLDKLNRRMHLSKVKHSKFNESGQLLVFYLISAVWGGHIILRESYITSISKLWEGYPHAEMQFIVKFFFIIQLSYWLHCFPELYFQKIKKDEIGARIQYSLLYLVFIGAAYFLNFTRIALILIVLHYLVESLFHFSRLVYFSDKTDISNSRIFPEKIQSFMVWNVLFVLIRLGSIIMAVLTFWYGLDLSSSNSIDFSKGNFNINIVRINCLLAVCLLQAWMMWNFITFHLKRMRERAAVTTNTKKKGPTKTKDRKNKRSSEEEENELPEVDQHNKKESNPRGRGKSKKN